MKTNSRVALVALLMLMSIPMGARVTQASLSFTLDCVISGNNTCTDSSLTWGTVTLDEVLYNTNQAIKITVDLVGTDNKILSVGLNYNDTLFDNSTPFQMLSGTVAVNEDASHITSWKILNIIPLDESDIH